MSEDDLAKLLGMIDPYFHTYPGISGKQALHDACEELERRGLVRRHFAKPRHVCWVKSDAPSPSQEQK